MVKKYLLVVVFIIGGVAQAQKRGGFPQTIETPFNVTEVVERVSHNSTEQSGEFLIDTSIAYAPASGEQKQPSVAFDGTNYFVVWQNNGAIYGSRLSQTGAVLDSDYIALSTGSGIQSAPSVTFDGNNYFIVWTEGNGTDSDIYGARVNPAGMVIDSFPVSTEEGNQSAPALARGSGNQVLVAYSGWAGTVGGKTYNTMRIWGNFYPFVGIGERLTPYTSNLSSAGKIFFYHSFVVSREWNKNLRHFRKVGKRRKLSAYGEKRNAKS